MLIRSTRKACFVILRNGLMLELVYAAAITGYVSARAHDWHKPDEPSHGVWLMGESVLFEVRAGQA